MELVAHSDTNWAGCIKTRKSTSAGGIIYGKHLVRSWSKTQAGIALSSAEAELGGVVRTTAEMLGFASMMRDLGRVLPGKGFIYADASAALGIIQRRGVGSIRHLDTRLLWVQDKIVKEVVDGRRAL